MHVITGLGNGGAEGVLYRLCQAGEVVPARIVVISLTGPGIYAEPLRQLGVEVYCLSMERNLRLLAGAVGLYRLIRKINPEVVQTWMYHADMIGGVAARLAGVRAVVWNIRHANLDPRHNSRLTLLIVRVCALLSRTVPAAIVSCSQVATEAHKAIGYDQGKFVDIPNGYCLDKLSPSSDAKVQIRSELGIGSAEFVVGMVARFDPQKDHRNLLEALRLLRASGYDFTTVLAGPGMDGSNSVLASHIAETELQDVVRLVGPRADVSKLMNAFDIHVLSSLGEGFPNVVAEAMACGTPCIATDVGDARLIIGNVGWVVPRKDPGSLAAAMRLALLEQRDQPEAWRSRCELGRNRIEEKFGIGAMTRAYAAVWNSVRRQDAKQLTRPPKIGEGDSN